MRVALDATPLLGTPTGIARCVAGLIEGLGALPDRPEVILAGFSRSGGEPVHPGATWSPRRVPARALQALWARVPFPPVEWLSGRCEVFHGTNYVLPPSRRAVGVVSLYDLTYLRYPGMITDAVARYRVLVPQSLRRAQAVITPCRTVAEEVIEEYHLDPALVQIARPGVDPAWATAVPATASWLQAHGLPTSYVLAVGTLEPRKNLRTLVAAHRLLGPDAPPLVLVGSPGWGEQLALTPADRVHLTGWLSDAELRSLVAGAAVLAFPSLYEGYGLPPLEALACGTPVVCSDLPVLREVLGAHAVFAPAEDVEAFADALARVLAAPGDPAAGVAHAAARTWPSYAGEVMAAYRAALAVGR